MFSVQVPQRDQPLEKQDLCLGPEQDGRHCSPVLTLTNSLRWFERMLLHSNEWHVIVQHREAFCLCKAKRGIQAYRPHNLSRNFHFCVYIRLIILYLIHFHITCLIYPKTGTQKNMHDTRIVCLWATIGQNSHDNRYRIVSNIWSGNLVILIKQLRFSLSQQQNWSKIVKTHSQTSASLTGQKWLPLCRRMREWKSIRMMEGNQHNQFPKKLCQTFRRA